MTKRISSALCAVALLALGIIATPDAQARTSRSNDSGGSGTSRSCLTSAARSLLDRIESRFGRMQIVSTCRAGATIAGSGRPSRHASGNAIDFDAGGRKWDVINWLKSNHHSGGTMTYSGMDHVHVDIGSHFVSLSSGGGRSASTSNRRRNRDNSRVASGEGSSRPAKAWKHEGQRMALGVRDYN